MRILAINGSLRSGSINEAVLNAAVAAFPSSQIDIYDCLRDLPHFDPSLSHEASPDSVEMFRRRISESDGILITTPEYAHSIPGILKNALDWVVGSGELVNKPVAIISASTAPTGGLRAQMALVQTLLAQSADIVALLPVAGAKLKVDAEGRLTHRPTLRRVCETVSALMDRCLEL